MIIFKNQISDALTVYNELTGRSKLAEKVHIDPYESFVDMLYMKMDDPSMFTRSSLQLLRIFYKVIKIRKYGDTEEDKEALMYDKKEIETLLPDLVLNSSIDEKPTYLLLHKIDPIFAKLVDDIVDNQTALLKIARRISIYLFGYNKYKYACTDLIANDMKMNFLFQQLYCDKNGYFVSPFIAAEYFFTDSDLIIKSFEDNGNSEPIPDHRVQGIFNISKYYYDSFDYQSENNEAFLDVIRSFGNITLNIRLSCKLEELGYK